MGRHAPLHRAVASRTSHPHHPHLGHPEQNQHGHPERVRASGRVDANEKGEPTAVNVRLPLQLLRAGVRLASLIPLQAHDELDATLSKHGIPLTLSQIKPENLEELIDHLEDLRVDVDAKEEKAKVRVFCE
jgi:hypothetical protein